MKIFTGKHRKHGSKYAGTGNDKYAQGMGVGRIRMKTFFLKSLINALLPPTNYPQFLLNSLWFGSDKSLNKLKLKIHKWQMVFNHLNLTIYTSL